MALQNGILARLPKLTNIKNLCSTVSCWRLPRANRIAFLCAVLYSHQWKAVWKNSN